jgi:hypothetical protein
MPFKKGGGRPGGRAKGTPNASTANAREAIALFVDQNSALLQELLIEIRQQDGPAAAFRCITDLIEYHIPKLARTELTGKDGGEMVTRHVVELHEGPPPRQE